jgi:thiamine kinase-like enzyme
MVFLLNQTNVFEYVADLGYHSEDIADNIKSLPAKNFNLLLTLREDLQLLVKQERHNQEGKAAGEFVGEWQVQKLMRNFPALSHWQPFVSEVLHFDKENSILVFRYLSDYRDLMDFYLKESVFPIDIAAQLGALTGTFHRNTYQRGMYREAIASGASEAIDASTNKMIDPQPDTEQPVKKQLSIVQRMIRGLERLTPEIFGNVPDDGLKFYALYQRYDSLGQALVELGEAFQADCLTHNDLKLNNVLLHNDWEQVEGGSLRLIDWERSAWGDPAYDLGTLIGSYLQMWLGSLVVSKSLSIEESLSLAMTPLDRVQPSIAALMGAYLAAFPQILVDRPDFVERSVQFAGLALIQGIQASIEYQKTLGNSGIAQLQVAKSLLCRPVQSMPTVFGTLQFMPQVAA